MVAPVWPSIQSKIGEQVVIAAIHPAFSEALRPLALMEYADQGLISVAHSKCFGFHSLAWSRSHLSCHHVMFA